MSLFRPILHDLDPDAFRDLQVEQRFLFEQELEQEQEDKMLKNFIEYVPRSMNTIQQRKPHVRVETQPNGRVRFHFYAVVRDWLKFSEEEQFETYVELLLDPEMGNIIIRRLRGDEADKPTAIPVRGIQNSAYITLAGFTTDFSIASKKYEAELITVRGSRAVLIQAELGDEL